MQVDFQGVVARLADLDRGAFFVFHDGEKPVYGIAALHSGDPVAVLLNGSAEPGDPMPSVVAHHSVENRNLLAIAGAAARPSLSAQSIISADAAAKAPGSMIIAGSEVFLRVAKRDVLLDLNLSTGIAVTAGHFEHAVCVSRWSVVRPLHGEYEKLVVWPNGR